MRIGASFILIEGYCYQSYQWKFLRPLGRLSHVLSFLDKYEVDEICITRPIRKVDSSSTLLNDFEQVKLSLSNSPISIGGGIRSLKHLKALSELPVERIHFSHAFLARKENIINQSINLYGKQAIVATLPVKLKDKDLLVYDCAKATFRILDSNVLDFINESADEVMLIDVQNEGIDDKFNFRILEQLNINNEKLIISGGLGHKTIKQAKDLGIASCLIENRILQKENYIKTEL